jgi:hypothetical protein
VAIKHAEMLGLAGVKSRVFKGATHPADRPAVEANPFDKFKNSPDKPPRK